jgi:integrase
MSAKTGHRAFGFIRRLPSKMYQASYLGPDGKRHNAPTTFETKGDADSYLGVIQAAIIEKRWRPTMATPVVTTLRAYAGPWLADRDLKPRTRDHYRRLLDRLILPRLGDMPLREITPDVVRSWHADLSKVSDAASQRHSDTHTRVAGGAHAPTLRAHAYALLRSILATAVDDGGLIPSNPCHIKGAGISKRVHKIEPLTLDQLATLVAAMPERLQAMVLLAAWCGLRFGELTELRRSDLDLPNGRIKIRRAVVRANGEVIVGSPKSDAGTRDVAIPPHLVPVLKAHVAEHAAFGRDTLLFPGAGGGHLAPSSLYGHFYPARAAAGRPDLRWHDLRHTGAVLAAGTGATLADLMARLGHSTQGAALRYQHASQNGDAEIARLLSVMAEAQ